MNNFLYSFFLFSWRCLSFVVLTCLSWTFKYETKGIVYPKPKAVYVFWHRNIIPLLLLHKNQKNVILISSSKDGDLIAEPTKAFGYLPIRGSSSKRGDKALKEMIKLSKSNSLAITPDGPKGPAETFKDGAFQLAYLAKLPMIAAKVQVKKAVIFKSWDRFVLPLPFSKIYVTYSPPIPIEDKQKFSEYKEYFENFL